MTKVGIIIFDVKDFKCIPIGDHFYWIALDTIHLLLKTNNGNMYILVTIDHDADTTIKYLKDEIICRFGVPKFVLTNNGDEWST